MIRKTAIVTGAAAGIGAAISRRLAQDGIPVGVLDVDGDGADRVAEEIVAQGGRALALQASIASRADVAAAASKLRGAFGPINVVVNNGGITGTAAFEDLTDAEWDRMMEVNLKGTFIVTQTVLPDMKAAKWGRIVNISSSSAQTGAVNMAHYSASKGGMIAMTRTLAQELGPWGITVNNIPPGTISNTIMFEASKEQTQVASEAFLATVPVRRMGIPEDMAQACSWLVSDECGYVTGQTIGVNGGRVVS